MAYTVPRPAAAFALTLAGGVTVLLVGSVITAVGVFVTLPLGGIGGMFGAFGIMWGVLIIFTSFMLFTRVKEHVLWGSLAIVFSILSIFGSLGGLFIGLILGIIGGILGIIWNPEK